MLSRIGDWRGGRHSCAKLKYYDSGWKNYSRSFGEGQHSLPAWPGSAPIHRWEANPATSC